MLCVLLKIGYMNIVNADPPPTPPGRGVGTVEAIKEHVIFEKKR